MDSMVNDYLKRARSELDMAEILFKISNSNNAKQSFNLFLDSTYYSGVISHAYYAIFYSAKAILLTKNIKTEAPEIHKKTFEAFKEKFVDSGILDVKLLEIYKRMIIRADELLQIFKDEKWKRGHFTYKTIPQANKEPSEESIKNAVNFIKNIRAVLEK
jgi:uncharacterized protein (UPF0332 family)